MIIKKYNTLWNLLIEMRAHALQHKSEIIIADDPKTLLVGWAAISINDDSDKIFYIPHSNLRHRLVMGFPDNPVLLNKLRELIRTQNGRKQIGELISIFPDKTDLTIALDRFVNLKAFW